MDASSSPLDRSASVPLLRRLFAADILPADELKRLEQYRRQSLPWAIWLDRGLLALGVILILAGIGYFFAHNWDRLTEDDKLVLAGGSVLLAAIGSVVVGVDRFSGKVLLTAASALVGVFIAVFSQIYQTGADTYELFRDWAILILPWVILGRFVPLWLFALTLVNLAAGFYGPLSIFSFESCFRSVTISLFGLNLAALVVREIAGWAKVSWLDREASLWILLTATLTPASVETIYEIIQTFDSSRSSNSVAPFVVIAHAALLAGLAFYFIRLRPSLPPLALITLSACSVATALAVRLIFSNSGPEQSGQWFIMGIMALAIFGGGVFLLRQASQRISAHR